MERGVYVGAGITALSAIAAYGLLPITGMVNSPTYNVFFVWVTVMTIVIASHAFWEIAKMGVRGQDRPIAALWSRIEPQKAKVVAIGSLMLALNLTFFCIIKPQLGQLVDFTADPLLADIDRLLFFGVDPWRLTLWFNHESLSLLYHRAWFLWLAIAIYIVLLRPASEEKDRLIISYVAMWSIFGPLVHLALPAAGPVFYDELGLGDRFIELQQSARSQGVAWYLWTGYTNKMFFPASGISAMPSLHLATMFWTLLALRNTRWMAAAIVFTIYIFIGSVAIGWHYAIDGIVGGAGAVLCYWIAGIWLRQSAGNKAGPEFAKAGLVTDCPPETV